MSYHVVHGEHEFSYDSIQGVIQQLVDSEYPFDPTEDEDVQIFLNKEIFNEKIKENLRKIIPKVPKIEAQKLKIRDSHRNYQFLPILIPRKTYPPGTLRARPPTKFGP